MLPKVRNENSVLEMSLNVWGELKCESQRRTGCSNAPAQPCQGRGVLFCEAWGTAALGWQCWATWEKQYLLSWFKQVIIVHEQIRSWRFVIAKLPFSYAFGLHPKDTTLPVQKWNLGDCLKCWRLPPLTYFLLYQSHSWLDRKAMLAGAFTSHLFLYLTAL